MNSKQLLHHCGWDLELDHLAPLLGFLGDEICELDGRAQPADGTTLPFNAGYGISRWQL